MESRTLYLQAELSHFLWIGGGTDAGKTTVTGLLTERHALQVYHYDKRDGPQHEILAETVPRIRAFLDASDEERWIKPEPEDLVQRTLLSFQDRWPLVIDELLALPTSPKIVAEGFGFTPEIIAPILLNKNQAIWLVPTDEFKRESMVKRDKHFRRLEMSDPERAINNLVTRDKLLASRVVEQADMNGLRWVEVDGSKSPEEMLLLLESHFEIHL